MKASNSKGDARTVGHEGGKIHCLWRALEQGLFPFMMDEVGELTEKNKVFAAVCEAAVKPETFEYAKWKGIGRPSGRRGGCRSATTLRPYPSGRRPRTESASSRNLNQTSRNPGAAWNGRPGRTPTPRSRSFRKTATGARNGMRTASRGTGKAARSTPPSPTTASPSQYSRRRRRADDAVCHALLSGTPGNGHETDGDRNGAPGLSCPTAAALAVNTVKCHSFSYDTTPLHAPTNAEREFMNYLIPQFRGPWAPIGRLINGGSGLCRSGVRARRGWCGRR